MSAAPFDLAAIRARALADPGKPAGSCRWCGKPFVGGRQSCASADGFRWCHRPSAEQIACADRAALVAELDRLHEAIAAFTTRMRGTVHGQRNGDADEVLW